MPTLKAGGIEGRIFPVLGDSADRPIRNSIRLFQPEIGWRGCDLSSIHGAAA